MWKRSIIAHSARRLRSYASPFVSLPFPRWCPVCGGRRGDGDAVWCAACAASAGRVGRPLCTHCHQLREFDASACPECGSVQAPVATLALGVFDQAWRATVHAVKYRGDRDLAIALGVEMARQIPDSHACDMIVPVPTHPRKRRERGFGHAETIAASLSRALHVESTPDALRFARRHMRDQTRLRGEARFRNLHEAFTVATPNSVTGRHVLVVDDVTTTGATLREAGRALMHAGAASVLASVVCLNLGILPEAEH